MQSSIGSQSVSAFTVNIKQYSMFSFYEFLVRKGWSNNYKIALSWTYAKHFLLRKALAVPRALNALMNGCVRLANAMLICTLRTIANVFMVFVWKATSFFLCRCESLKVIGAEMRALIRFEPDQKKGKLVFANARETWKLLYIKIMPHNSIAA